MKRAKPTAKPAAKAVPPPKKPPAKNAVATRRSTELAEVSQDDIDSMLYADAGGGMEEATTSDFIIPRIAILQGLSPRVTKGSDEYDPSLKVGDIFDFSSKEALSSPLLVVPMFFQKRWLQWPWPRRARERKPPIAVFEDASCLHELGCERDDVSGKMITADGDSIIEETAIWYVINWEHNRQMSVISFASSRLRAHKEWLHLCRTERMSNGAIPPTYYRGYLLSTVPQSNEKGSWVGWQIDRSEKLQDLMGNDLSDMKSLMEDIKSFKEALNIGKARVDHRDDDGGDNSEEI